MSQTQELRVKLAETQDSKSAVEKEFSASKLAFSNTEGELNLLNRKVETLIAEKTQVLERVDKKDAETKELQSELESLRKANVATRKNIVELESQAQQFRSTQLSTKLKEDKYEQEILLLQKNNSWLNSQIQAKSSDSNAFRSEKLSMIDTLQNDLASIQSSHHALEKSYDSLKEQSANTSKKLDDSLLRIKELQDMQLNSEEGFRVEMESQKRLADLWERSSNEAKKRVEALEKMVESERKTGASEASRLRNEREHARSKVEHLEKRLASIEQGEDPFDTNENNALSTPRVARTPISKGTSNMEGVFSPSAKIIAEIQRGGGSLVQLYSDLQDTKTRLEREKFKNESLRDQMNNILEEMESQAPAILAEREENRRLESELTELSMQLESVSNNSEELKGRLKSNEIKAQDSAREVTLLSKHVTDLSRQVQHLLVQNQLSSDSDPLTPQEHSALQLILKGEDATESDTNQLISQRLVLFKDTLELQRQNENLLKITRELGQKLENDERDAQQKLQEVESSAVSGARDAIEALQSEIGTLQTKIGALQRERDMFRRILSHKTQNGVPLDQVVDSSTEAAANAHAEQLANQNSELSSSLKESQSQFESFKTETNITIETLNDQIVTLTNDRSNLQIQLAKTTSQLELAAERFKTLEDNFQSLRNENQDFKKRSHSLHESLSKQELRSQQLSEEAITTNSLLEGLRSEAANLKAEKSLWKSIEERLTKENAGLIEERGRLNSLLASAQSVESERTSSAAEAQQRLSLQLSAFEEELTFLRSKLQSQEDEMRNLNALKESQSSEYQDRINQLSAELHAARDSLLTTKEQSNRFEIKLREAEFELKNASEHVALLEQAQLVDSDDILRQEVTTLTKKLNSAEIQLSQAKDVSAQLEQTSGKAEADLQSLTSEYQIFMQKTDESLIAKENELLNVRDQFSAATDLLNSTQEELNFFKEEATKKMDGYISEEKRLQGLLKALQGNDIRFQESLQSMKDDISRQASLAGEAQQNYEQEVVKHADTANILQGLRKEYSQLKDQLAELTSIAETASDQLLASETSWESQRELYEKEITNLKNR